MLAATKVKMSGSEKNAKIKNRYDISSIKRVTRKFLEVSLCSGTKERHKKCTKKVGCTCKVAFSLIRPTIVFHRSHYLRCLALHDFTFCLYEQTINILERFAFSHD